MHVNSVNEAQSLLHQLQGRQEVSTQCHWMSRLVSYVTRILPSNPFALFIYSKNSTEPPEPTIPRQKSQSLIKKVAAAAFELLSEPKGIEIAKQLVQESLLCFGHVASEKAHLLVMKEAELSLQNDDIDEAKRLVGTIEEIESLDQAAAILADELRDKTLRYLEQLTDDTSAIMRLADVCETLNVRAKERARLYRFMVEQDLNFPKTSCDTTQPAKRHHFLLRMAKSLPTLEHKEFPGLKPLEGLAMIIEDLDAYLEHNPSSQMAKTAKKILLRCRSLTLEGDMAERLSRDEKNPNYLDIYFGDITKEVQGLKEHQKLILLGGSFDHAILHSVQQACKGLKTYNSGLGILKHRPTGNGRFQTHIISNLSKNNFTKEVLKSLFAPKLVDVSIKTNEEKKELSNKQIDEIYHQLNKLADKRPARLVTVDDPSQSHHRQLYKTCLRDIYLMWLKEEILKEEYKTFKVSFSERAQKSVDDEELLKIGQQKLQKRKNKIAPTS